MTRFAELFDDMELFCEVIVQKGHSSSITIINPLSPSALPSIPYQSLPINTPPNELAFIILAIPSCAAGVGGFTNLTGVES